MNGRRLRPAWGCVMPTVEPLAAMHRANQAFHEQTLEMSVLNCGVACFCPMFPNVGNQFREVSLTNGRSPAEAFSEADAFFGAMGQTCRRWTPAMLEPSEPLAAYLRSRDFYPCPKAVLALQPWPELPAHPGVRLVSGRAVRQALRQLILEDGELGGVTHREFSAYLMNESMDHAAFDLMVAMVDGQAVGHGAVLQVGPVAAIYSVYVEESFRGQGVGLAIMTDLLNQCRRLDLRTVVLEVEEHNEAANRLYARCGFVRAGTSLEYRQVPTAAGDQ